MIDVILKNLGKDRTLKRDFFVRVCEATEPYLKIPRGHRGEVGITLIGPTAMRSLNRERRGVDASTDVLSFPLHMKPIKGYTTLLLGDLFVCYSVVRAKAKQSGMPVRSQMAWTIAHGLLHLAGYDHERSTSAARAMHALESKILTHVFPLHNLRH